MTKKKLVEKVLQDCFQKVIEPHLFELETSQLVIQIICEFVEECAVLGHGVQAEAYTVDDQFKGVSFMHEDGYSGVITIKAVLNMDK